MNALAEMGATKRLLQKLKARQEWEAQNPELAEAWTEALHEDHALALQRERANTMRIARDRANHALVALEIHADIIAALREPNDEPPLLAAKSFLASDRLCLLLLGEIGTGKSTAAAYVLQEAIAARYAQNRPSGYEARTNEPAMLLRATTFARTSLFDPTDRAQFEQTCRCDALLIDDLGTEGANSTTAQQLDELFERRLALKLRTVITGNLDAPTLAARIGERAADRIRQYATTFVSKGPSLRTGKRYTPLKVLK